MRTNKPSAREKLYTHEGGLAAPQRPEVELRRAVSTCLLWENTFYEKGNDIAQRIGELCKQVKPAIVAQLAREARANLKLRHVPLWLALQLVRLRSPLAAQTIVDVIQRPDELCELLALYWKDGRTPLSAQLKKGLAEAFTKFSEFQLSKWDKDGPIKLRDILFLCHAKPRNVDQSITWRCLIDGTLAKPDTWEVALSRGADKKATWERLLKEGKLGDMALLMNLRNMAEVGVSPNLIEAALKAQAGKSKALPFRYVAAVRAAPQYAAILSDSMLKAISGDRLDGSTAVVVDVSGSMDHALSKGSLTRLDAAGTLAVLVRELCPAARIFTFSQGLAEVGNFHGLALLESIHSSQPHHNTYLTHALHELAECWTPDRVIVVTDEQSQDGTAKAWTKYAYLINVAPYKPGLDVSQGWTRISGWSERVVDWIIQDEKGSIDG